MTDLSKDTNTFLLELGMEELPQEDLNSLVRCMVLGIVEILSKYQWDRQLEDFRWVITARRIGLVTPPLSKILSPRITYKHGPVISSAINEGQWTDSVQGFFKGLGIKSGISPQEITTLTIKDLEDIPLGKVIPPPIFISPRKDGILCVTGTQQLPPVAIEEIFTQFLQRILLEKDFAKMRWLEKATEEHSKQWDEFEKFIRPVRWLVCLHGDRVIPLRFCGVESTNKTYPHRIYFSPKAPVPQINTIDNGVLGFGGNQPINISHVTSYETSLQEGGVFPSIFSFSQLREDIRVSKVSGVVGAPSRKEIFQKFTMDFKEDFKEEKVPLLEKLTGITKGNFFQVDSQSLFSQGETLTEGFSLISCKLENIEELPREIVESELYFNQKMMPFIKRCDDGGCVGIGVVLVDIPNTSLRSLEGVKRGYERVLRARFLELSTIYKLDLQRGDSHMLQELSGLIVQQKLGTYGERFERVRQIVVSLDVQDVEKISSKIYQIVSNMYIDLVSKVVDELPELRKKMSRYYISSTRDLKSNIKNYSKDLIYSDNLDHLYIQKEDGLTEYTKIFAGRIVRYLCIYWDKLENIISHFAAGLSPTSYSDPYRVKQEADDLIECCFNFIYLTQKVVLDVLEGVDKEREDKFLLDINSLIRDELDVCVEKISNKFFSIPLGHIQKREKLPVSFKIYQQIFSFLLQRLRYQVERKSSFINNSFFEGENYFYCCDAVVTPEKDIHKWLGYYPERESNYLDVIFRYVHISGVFVGGTAKSCIQELAMQIKRIKNITQSFEDTRGFWSDKQQLDNFFSERETIGRSQEALMELFVGKKRDCHFLLGNLLRFSGESYEGFFDWRRPGWGTWLQKYIQGDPQGKTVERQRGFISLVREIFEVVRINDECDEIRDMNMNILIFAARPLVRVVNWEVLAAHVGKNNK